MKVFKGTLALDIDGTLTTHHRLLNCDVKNYLESLALKGWRLLFVTGRTFSFTEPILQEFKKSYWLSVQNGAILFEMPGEKILSKETLSHVDIPFLHSVLTDEGVGLLIESGRFNRDICYYIPEEFPPEETDYLHFRQSISPEKWEKCSSFKNLPITEFAVGKFFAKEKVALKIAEKVRSAGLFQVTVIRDPFRPGFHLALISAKQATKGHIIDKSRIDALPVIAAGDDYNDLDMLKKADIKIVMGNAPLEMHSLGDILAPPVFEQGIIPALEEAFRKLGES